MSAMQGWEIAKCKAGNPVEMDLLSIYNRYCVILVGKCFSCNDVIFVGPGVF